MIKEQLQKIFEDTAGRLGYQIYDFSIYLKGENSVFTIKIDHLNGISHSDCEIYSRELSTALDAAEFLPNYSIEVSSPGLNRRIRNIDEFRRFNGAPVKIVFNDNGRAVTVKGTYSISEDGFVRLKEGAREYNIAVTDITSANLDY
jgi:ribosome maturation factor RimP